MQSEKRHLTCVKLLDVKLTKRTASFVVREKYNNMKISINVGLRIVKNPRPAFKLISYM